MAVSRGRDAVILVGTSSPATTVVAKASDYNVDKKLIRADATTNDSAGADEHAIIGASKTLTHKIRADRADAGQIILFNADEDETQIYVEYRPKGTGSTLPYERFLASVDIKRAYGVRALAEYDVTYERSGPTTYGTQT